MKDIATIKDEIYVAIVWMKQHSVNPTHILCGGRVLLAMRVDRYNPSHYTMIDGRLETLFGIPIVCELSDSDGWRVVCDSSAWN